MMSLVQRNGVITEVSSDQFLKFTPPPSNQDVNNERENRLHAGASITIAGVTAAIPLRGRSFDQTVYLALLMRAQGFKAAGMDDTLLNIRSSDDVIHRLTPDQMISLISQAMQWFERVMTVSWAMKDATGNFPNGIPKDYNEDKHWPE